MNSTETPELAEAYNLETCKLAQGCRVGIVSGRPCAVAKAGNALLDFIEPANNCSVSHARMVKFCTLEIMRHEKAYFREVARSNNYQR